MDATCKEPGRLVPRIDRNRCEAKKDCIAACPYHVFEIRPLSADDKATMTLVGRMKAWAHGNEQAFVVKGEDCHACGLCVTACPEKAIGLVAV